MLVWDAPTRLFHWTLVLLVIASVTTGKFDGILGPGTLEWHKRSGLAILALLLFRLAWGLAGGTHARFSSFVRGPAAVIEYAKGLLAHGARAGNTPGHNPLGGWSVLAMLACLLVQAGTGLFITQEDYGFEAPLAKYVSRAWGDRLSAIHQANFWVIAGLVSLHLAAIAFYTLVKREDLVGAMLGGRKHVPAGVELAPSRGGSLARGAVVLALAAAGVWALAFFA